jgi:hypothetical protein
MSDPDSGYLRYLKALLNHVDQAMAAEGVEPEVRDRVVSRVLYGAPTPDLEPAEPAARTLVGPPVNALTF